MPICKNCGVELKDGTKICPLCGMSLNGSSPQKGTLDLKSSEKEIPGSPNLSHWIWELFTFLMIAGFIVVFMVDFAFGMSISWSKIPLVSIAYLWLTVTLAVKIEKKIYLLIMIEFLILLIFLWLLEMFIAGSSWFHEFALPFLILSGIILELTLVIVYGLKLKSLTILSICFISLGIFLLGLEAVLNRFLQNRIFVSWSLVACACLIPISGFILYLKSQLKKRGKELEKYFHT